MKKMLSVLLSVSMILSLFAGIGADAQSAQAAQVLLADGTYVLTSVANEMVVCAENYGNDPLVANRDSHGGNWEEFILVNNSDGTISLQSAYNGLYVCAVIDEENQLLARSASISTWEKFEIEHITESQYALKAVANEKYVQADLNNSGVLTAASDSIGGAWEAFIFTRLTTTDDSLAPVVTQDGQNLNVTWEGDEAASYDVYRAVSRYATYSKVATVTGLGYTDTAPNSDKYANYYKVAVAGSDALSKPGSLEIEMFGEDMYVFAPTDDVEQIYNAVNDIYLIQGDVTNGTPGPGQQFGDGRYAFAFKTGDYSGMSANTFQISYYMQVLGLGKVPTDVTIKNIHVPAVLSNDNATCNFWMSIENIGIAAAQYDDSDEYWQFKWAVSQAAPARRLYVNRSAKLNNYDGYASGGFISDSVFTKNLGSNTQQQYYIRNTNIQGQVYGVNWNMVMQGVNYGSATATNFQALNGAKGVSNWTSYGCYTDLDSTDVIREKPFLYFDETEEEYKVFIPGIRENSSGISWSENYIGDGVSVDISKFYIARADRDNAASINAALAAGKNIILSPGIYYAEEPIVIDRANTIFLGLGLATIIPTNTEAAIKTADVGGVSIAGVILDADSYSKNMLVVGEEGCNKDHSANPTVLQDVFVRIGGVHGGVASTDSAIVINSNNVIGDDFWVWRADHGDGVGWYLNTANVGVEINGDDVTMYGLMVEHFQKYDVIWRGENGKTYFLQNEKCYDPQNQAEWMSHDGTLLGYAAYKVSNNVKNHYAVGLGSYNVFIYTNGAVIYLDNAIEVPDTPGVMIENVCIVELASGGADDGFHHIVNGTGPGINSSAYAREVLLYYCNHKSVSYSGEEYGYQTSDDPLADRIIAKEAKSVDNAEMYVIDYWSAGGPATQDPEDIVPETAIVLSSQQAAVLTQENAYYTYGSFAPAANGSEAYYYLDVKEAGTYTITYSITGEGSGTQYNNAFSVYTGEADTFNVNTTANQTISIPALWTTDTVTTRKTIALEAGTQVLRIASAAAGYSLSQVEIAAQTVTEIDLAAGESRTIDADVLDGAAGTYVIINGSLEYTVAGNAFDYNVNVANAGTYGISINYGLESSSDVAFTLETVNSDGTVTTLGSVSAPATGSWSAYSDTEPLTVSLPAGASVLRLTITGNSVNVTGLGITCAELENQPEVVTPSIVTGVKAVYADGKIQITWDDNGADMYKVVRSDGRSSYINLTYGATAAGWTDTKDLVEAQLYYYRVIGYFKDAEGNLVMGDMSEAAGVVATDTLPAKIVNVEASVSGNSVTLTWDKAESARYYKVSRAAGATGKYYSMKYNIETTTYSESAVAAGTYRYKVVGYYKDVDSSWIYGELSDTLYVTIN